MWYPAHIDGCSLVVLRPRGSILGGYDVVESGCLEYDGQELRLASDGGSRVVTQAELAELQPVAAQNRIAACQSFDFFRILPADAG
jgi:hypothetical protein